MCREEEGRRGVDWTNVAPPPAPPPPTQKSSSAHGRPVFSVVIISRSFFIIALLLSRGVVALKVTQRGTAGVRGGRGKGQTRGSCQSVGIRTPPLRSCELATDEALGEKDQCYTWRLSEYKVYFASKCRHLRHPAPK